MSNYTISKRREGRFNDLYEVTQDGNVLLTDSHYLRARKVLHECGVSAERHLEMLDGLPVGTVYGFEVK